MRPKLTPLYYCICWFFGASMVGALTNLGADRPSSTATCGTVGAGGNSIEAVEYLMA